MTCDVRVTCDSPVALEGNMVTMKSAPAAHSLADVAGMPPAALSLCIASALRLREALARALRRKEAAVT